MIGRVRMNNASDFRYAVVTLLLLTLPVSVNAQTSSQVEKLYRRAEQRHRARDLEGASADFTKVIELTTGLQTHGRSKTTSGARWRPDLVDSERIRVIDPRAAPAYLARGHVRIDQQDYEGALSDFDEALRLAPGFAEAWFSRGRL